MTGQTGDSKSLFKRLPQTIVPTHYDVTIKPYLDQFKFDGNVNIHLKVGKRLAWIRFVDDLRFRLKNQRML